MGGWTKSDDWVYCKVQCRVWQDRTEQGRLTSIAGIKNARVFPVPVRAFTKQSPPLRIMGIDSACTWVIYLEK